MHALAQVQRVVTRGAAAAGDAALRVGDTAGVPTATVDLASYHREMQAHADAIPGAQLSTVPSKDADQAGFTADIRTALHQFLDRV